LTIATTSRSTSGCGHAPSPQPSNDVCRTARVDGEPNLLANES
jgi:hypothetical protein